MTIGRTHLGLLLFVGLLAHGLMLVNDGIYWDDWTVFNVDDRVVLNTFRESGLPLKAIIHVLLKEWPIAYHWTTFLAIIASTVVFYLILGSVPEIDGTERLILALLFEVFPLNSAKVAMSIAPYMVGLLLFTLGTLWVVWFIRTGRWRYHWLACVFLWVSFQIESFLVFFYAVLACSIAYHERWPFERRFEFHRMRRYLVLALLPIVYQIVKVTMLAPYGVYEGYNSIRWTHVWATPLGALATLDDNVAVPLFNALRSIWDEPNYFMALVPVWLALYLYFKRGGSADSRHATTLLGVGLAGYFLGVFPYLAVRGLLPTFGQGWLSRDQLVLAYGVPFIIVYGAKVVLREMEIRSRNVLLLGLSFVVTASVLADVTNNLSFLHAWFKQQRLMEEFSKSDRLRGHTTFVVEASGTRELDPFGEQLRYYELTGMMKLVFGDERRMAFVGEPTAADRLAVARARLYPEYNISGYQLREPEYLIRLTRGPVKIGPLRTLRALWYTRSGRPGDRGRLSELLAEVIRVEVVPL